MRPAGLLLVALLAAPLARGGEGAPAGEALSSEEARALLERWRARQREVRTLRVRFERVETSELFLDEVRSSGTLQVAKPEKEGAGWRLRRETSDALLLVNGDVAWVYLPGEKTAERYDLARLREQKRRETPGLFETLRAVVDLDAARIGERFEASVAREKEGLYRVSLVPRPEAQEKEGEKDPAERPAPEPGKKPAPAPAAAPQRRITLWLDEEGAFPQRVRVDEGADESWTESYSRLEVNPKLEDAVFDFTPPAGVKVVEPARAAE